MEPFNPSRRVIRFGVFEVNLSAGELRKNGRKLKLQEQPFQVLASLLDRPGEVVTREELRERLWPGDTYVDFDRSLNSAVNRLREALDDSANQPRFVETLPRRGYRFVAPLERHDRVGDLSSPIPPAAETVKAPTRETLQARLRRTRLERLVLLAALVVAVGVIVALWFRKPTVVVDAPFRRFGLPVRSAGGSNFIGPEISPDGKQVVYAERLDSRWGLRIQDLGRGELRELEGTDEARGPFWSPDGRFVGFAAGLELKKIPIDGGAPISLCRMPSTRFGGGTWSPDGRSIVISSGNPPMLHEVPADGGTPSLLFEPENSGQGNLSLTYPLFLPVPGRDRVLLFTRERVVKQERQRELVLRNLHTGNQEDVAAGMNVTYSPTGHLVYRHPVQLAWRPSALWAMPFSLKTLRPTGQAFPIGGASGLNPSVASDGTLVYLEYTEGRLIQLAWRDRSGKKLREVGEPQVGMAQVSLSPDGTTAAVSGEEFGWDVWLQDLLNPA